MTWEIAPHTPWTTDGDTVWVLNVDEGQVYALEVVAGLIWEQLDVARDLDGLVDCLVRKHGWDAHDIRDHVAVFVAELVERGLVQEKAQ